MNGFLVMCLVIISLSINLRYALLASSHLNDKTADHAQIDNLRRTVRDLAPCRPSKHNNPTSYVPADLQSCEYVFVREDTHKPPLSSPYRGPFLVLSRTDKRFRVQLNNRGLDFDR